MGHPTETDEDLPVQQHLRWAEILKSGKYTTLSLVARGSII